MNPRSEPTPAPPAAYPPPLWWTKRLLLGLLGLVLLLAGLHLLWAWHAAGRIAAEQQRLRAAGEPATLEDLDSPFVPDERNAVVYIRAASEVLARDFRNTGPANSNLTWRDELPYPPEWHESIESAVAAHAEALGLLRQARMLQEVDWDIQIRSPAIAAVVNIPGLKARALANLTGDAALRAHFSDNDREAIERLHDTFFIARAIDHQPVLVSHLVAIGIEALTLHRIMILSTGLRIGDGDPTEVSADREQVRQLIRYLLDDQPIREGFVRAMQGERILLIDTGETLHAGSRILRPMFQLDGARAAEEVRMPLEAIGKSNWHTGQAKIVGGEEEPDFNIWFQPRMRRERLTQLIGDNTSTWRRMYTTHMRVTMERRLAAVTIAVRMYHIDHGQYPLDLDALVPDYLASVPVDPMHPEGRPIGYLITADGTRPLIYSIGDEGTLDSIDEGKIPTRAMYGWQTQRRGHPDFPTRQFRDLSAWQDPDPPPPPRPWYSDDDPFDETEWEWGDQ